MRAFFGGLALCCLASCGSVDVAPEVAAFSGGLNKATSAMQSDLAGRAAEEEAAARSRAVAGGELLYVPPSGCTLAASGAGPAQECRLDPLVRAEVAPGSATAMVAYLDLLQAYAEALSLLATGTEPDAVGKAFGGLVDAAEGLAEAVPDLAPKVKVIAKANPPLTRLGTRLVEAQRLRLIRRVVMDASPGVTAALDRLIAYREVDDGLVSGAAALGVAYDRMEAARRAGVGYAVAVAGYETTHAEIERRLAASDAGRLMLIREAQGKLEARLSKPGSLKDYIGLIENLGALATALES